MDDKALLTGERATRFLILTVLYGSGIALVWWATSWMAALGVFITLWGLNTEQRFRREDDLEGKRR